MQYEIIDDQGVIESGTYEEMLEIFENASKQIDSWVGDLKLIKVLDIRR